MKDLMKRLIVEEGGVTAIEYALIAGFVAVVIIAGLLILGPALSNFFSYIGTTVNSAG
jgi:pilus assembly protein Flp/PilA